nr:aldose epimerase family protein [uncultured Dongia sp.]
MSITDFGALTDGTTVQEIRLSGGGLSLGVLTRGCVIRTLDFDAGQGPKGRVLGFKTIDPYLGPSPYFGCVAGRYANRIAGGRFTLDGHDYQLTRNEKDRTHLHGGRNGFSHRAWQVLDHGSDHVTLELISPAGEEGYPGTMTARCTYRIISDGVLEIDLTATTDAPTIINLATHSYFNLDGTPDILQHRLEIAAEHYTPVDATLIPTGEIAAVAGTPFDFRMMRPVGGHGATYDHNFVVDRVRVAAPRLMARLDGPESRTRLDVHSTEPGVQLYDSAGLAPTLPGLDGVSYGRHAGICLEPQIFPDSPNHANFPDATLRPGETYHQITQYRFSRI